SGTGSLTKTGAGVATLTGGGAQGAVAVNAGTLRFGQSGVLNADSLATANGATVAIGSDAQIKVANAFTLCSGATLALNDFSQTANNLSGAGNINLGQLNTTVLTTHAANDTTFSGVIGGAGQLSKTGTGTLTLSGTSTYTGGTTITDGTLVAANGSAMGTGAIANAAALHLDFASDSTLANTLSGTGSLTKTGAGVATLTGGGAQGAVAVNAGTLRFGQSGVFNADSLATANGATVAIGSDAQIKVANAFTLSSGATLDVLMGKNNNPAIAANSATIGGTLNIGGFAETAPDTASALTNLRFTVLRTTSGITGDFANVSLGSAASPVDYLVVGGRKSADNLEYDVGFGLTWRAGTTRGNGVFTLANATDKFNVDVVLADEAASATKWNGKDLTKNGAGTLTLSAKNTYSGLTVVNAGTLATGIADAFASSSAVAVNSGATLALNDFSQTANNLYGAGKISLGNLASTALTAHNSFDTVFSGVIGGAGQLNKTGAGTMTLLGTNTYGGGTTISDGTLVGSAASFGTGAILNKAALVIDQPSNATLANAINGTGTFTKSGSGVLTLTGNSNLSGPTSVEGGDLVVNGFLGNSAVTMQRGTTLRGNGTVGRTSIVSGARIAPGNSIGTLTVNGAYTQAGGSTFQAQVDPSSTRSDRIHVNGTATLAPGAVLEVSKIAPGEFSVNSNYTVLSATNGVTGTYTLTGDTGGAFYVLKEEYDANNVYLRANRVRNFTDAAGTRNEIATAGALDSMPDSNIIKRAVIALDTDDDARLAFNQLSGEIHASLKTALLGDSRNIRETAIDRIRQRFCAPGFGKDIAASDTAEDNAALETPNDGTCYRRTTRPAGWLRVLGSWGKTAGGNAARLSQDVAGILGGTDTTIGDIWNVGALIGYTHNGMKVDARSSYANSDNFHASIYGGMQRGPLGIRTGAAFAWHNIETHRSPAFPGYTDVLNADYNGRTLQVFGDMGYQLAMRRMNLEPFVNVAVVQTRTNSFKENGGAAALSGDRDHISSTYTTLGLRGSTTIDLPQGAKMTARGMLGWQHTFGTSVPVAGLAFADSNRYTVAGVPQGRNSLVVEAGVDFQISRRASIGVVYSGRVGGSTTTHAVQGRLSIQF
ncbi:MAG: autotransporter domain-containing protein, partial [Cupriavidus sp.]|nr:autotransporter domain-containing protein [Cupriavidus sp.]